MRLLVLLSLLTLQACASLPEGTQRSEDDPWERYNRAIYTFNDAVDSAILRPTAKGYRYITPDPVEQGISNFFSNLGTPLVAFNQFLQADFVDGFSDLGRFLINSTIGIGGLFDPATEIGLVDHNEDLGQTLAVWGIPSGPYLQLPFLGPSTLRDTFGVFGDSQIEPLYQYIDEPEKYYLIALNVINQRAQLLSLDEQLSSAYDPYTFLRDAYLQRREFLIHDGNPPVDDYYDDLYEDFDDFEDYDDPATGPDAPPTEVPEDNDSQPVPEKQGQDSGDGKSNDAEQEGDEQDN